MRVFVITRTGIGSLLLAGFTANDVIRWVYETPETGMWLVGAVLFIACMKLAILDASTSLAPGTYSLARGRFGEFRPVQDEEGQP